MRRADRVEHVTTRPRAGEDQPRGVQSLECGAVVRPPAALVVLEHGIHEIQPEALGVEVVVAQDQRAAGGARPLRGDPEGARVAQVQEPGGRGREASAVGRRGVSGAVHGMSF